MKKPICKVEDFEISFLFVFKTYRCLSHTGSFSCLRYFFASDYTYVYSANSAITTHFRAVILIHSHSPLTKKNYIYSFFLLFLLVLIHPHGRNY